MFGLGWGSKIQARALVYGLVWLGQGLGLSLGSYCNLSINHSGIRAKADVNAPQHNGLLPSQGT
jgi:hypothetical protein